MKKCTVICLMIFVSCSLFGFRKKFSNGLSKPTKPSLHVFRPAIIPEVVVVEQEPIIQTVEESSVYSIEDEILDQHVLEQSFDVPEMQSESVVELVTDHSEVEEPIEPLFMRIVHLAGHHRNSNELDSVLGDTEWTISSFAEWQRDIAQQGDVLIVSHMDMLPHLEPILKDVQYTIIWVRELCSDDQYAHIRQIAARDMVCVVVDTSYDKEYLRNREVPGERILVIPSRELPVRHLDRTAFYVPAGFSASQFKRIMVGCAAQGIRLHGASRGANYCAPFEGVLCIPGVMHDDLLVRYLKQGGIMFVPTLRFLKRSRILSKDQLAGTSSSAWYKAEYADHIQYFNCWDDLRTKLNSAAYQEVAQRMRSVVNNDDTEITSWQELIGRIQQMRGIPSILTVGTI